MAQAIEPGTIIGGTYEVTSLLGKGGMGAVWSARHLRLPGKRVAIKVLLGGGDDDEQSLARFRREAEIASRLGHPNIVSVSDFNTFPDGTPYQVLEFLDGESLGARLKRGPIPFDEAMGFARQMGSALAAAHREGIVHRDLKPENIFLCPTDATGQIGTQVKILDFGISKIRGSQTVKTQDQVLIGTPQYMSPEQAHGENQSVDQRTDVFALGAIVYEMLSGRAAFAGDSVVSVILNVVQKTPESLDRLTPGLAPGVVAAIGKALAKKADERFQDVATFIAALTGRLLETRPLDAVRTGPGGGVAGAPGAAKPLSQEEIMAATMVPAPGGSGGVASSGSAPASMSHSIPPGVSATVKPVPPAAGSGAGKMIFVGIAFAGLAVAAALFVKRSDDAAGVGGVPVASTLAATTSAMPDAGSRAALPPDAGLLAAMPADAARVQAAPAPPSTERAPGTGRPRGDNDGDKETLPAAVAAEIDEAEAQLAAGNSAEAVRKARHSLLGHRATRAFAILARAACQAGDLTNARAALQNIKGPLRARVIRDCAKRGLDLR